MTSKDDHDDKVPTEVLPPVMNSAEKSASFRKRRLSFPKHHLEDDIVKVAEDAKQEDKNDDDDDDNYDDEENDKAHTFRKRRLSLTLAKPQVAQDDDDASVPPPADTSVHRPAKRRRSSVTSAASGASSTTTNGNNQKKHKSLTLHSTELLGGPLPPPSPAVHNANILYRQQPAPPPPPPLDLTLAAALESTTPHLTHRQRRKMLNPRWKKRHQPTDESKFPFPKDIVGTFSCHGVEPIYGSEYDEAEEEEEEVSPDDDYDNDEVDDGGAVNKDDRNPVKQLNEEFVETTKEESESADCLESTDVVDEAAAPVKHTMAAKINQDRGGIVFPYGNSRRTALFAVYDGHGQGGELVSQYALHEVQRRLEIHPSFKTDLQRAFHETFLAVDDSLRYEPLIEPYYAGTTAVVALFRDQTLTLANAGDSRAVLAQRSGNSWKALDLTVDQNPDSPAEQARIERMGGFVSPPPGPGLSARVWLDSDLTQIGLAMARSIGDHAIAEVGVIAEPVVTTHTVGPHDDFLLLASDGVWEFLSSQEAIDIVGEHLEERGATKACQALIEAAASRWHDEEGEYRDDITAIVVRLPGLWDKLAGSSQG